MNNELKKLKIERDNLREKTRNKYVSIWKFWEWRKDNLLIARLERIVEINNIFYGARLQEKDALRSENDE